MSEDEDLTEQERIWGVLHDLGITIRANSVVDDLQRQYLPAEFQNIRY